MGELGHRLSSLWANPLTALAEHTPETCLAALIAQSFTPGSVPTHPAISCLEPPPTLAELVAASWMPSGTDERAVILAMRSAT